MSPVLVCFRTSEEGKGEKARLPVCVYGHIIVYICIWTDSTDRINTGIDGWNVEILAQFSMNVYVRCVYHNVIITGPVEKTGMATARCPSISTKLQIQGLGCFHPNIETVDVFLKGHQ
jgi:hypothetical protein